jgi:hypothetical protein
MPDTRRCPASRLPLSGLRPGDGVDCPVCRRRLFLTAPPEDRGRDPWSGTNDPRLPFHCTSNASLATSASLAGPGTDLTHAGPTGSVP